MDDVKDEDDGEDDIQVVQGKDRGNEQEPVNKEPDLPTLQQAEED